MSKCGADAILGAAGVYPEAFQQRPVGSVGSVGSVRNAGRKGSTRARVEAPFVGSVVSVGNPVASHTSNSVSNTPPSPLTWESNTSNTSNSSPISVGNDEDSTEALLAKVRRGDWLSQQKFEKLHYSVPDLVPEGFTVLAGPPKAGKSWLLLDWLLAVAAGGRALGKLLVPAARTVLYLALEDSDRRMQDRCNHLLRGKSDLPANFTYCTDVQPHQMLPLIDAFLKANSDTALVAIDTLGRVMPPMLTGETTYQRDYRIGKTLQDIARSNPGLGIIAAHHTRKTLSADFVESISGTFGLAGAADTIVVLNRDRNTSEGVLHVTGRDVEEADYALVSDAGRWLLDGKDLSESASIAEDRRGGDDLGEKSRQILDYIAHHPEGAKASEMAEKFGKQAYAYLSRLTEAGKLTKVERGIYCLPAKKQPA
jgi:hypothetical protein